MLDLNRRQFLQAAAVTGVSLAEAISHAKAPEANDRIGVAVIGVGVRGKDHVAGWLRAARSHIVAIVDPDEARANALCDVAEKAQGTRPKALRDMRRAFESSDVDAVSIATPNHWHALAGIWAMQAGKDVYVEKPVAYSIAEGAALVAAARKYNRICQVGTQCRSHAAIRNGIAFIQSGGIGEVKFARGLCYNRRPSIGKQGDYPVPANLDFDLWSGPAPFTTPRVTRPQFHYDWHWQRLYGNGDLGNQGVHQTDIARWGLGVDSYPVRVISYGGRLGYQAERDDSSYVDAGDTANTQVSLYDYGDKCLVFETRGLDASTSADEELNRLFQSKGTKVGVVFYGSQGFLVQRNYEHCIAYDADFNVIKQFGGGGDHYGNFLNACASRDHNQLNADVREGHLSAAISHLGNLSYYLGKSGSVEEVRETLAQVHSLDDNNDTLTRTVAHLRSNCVDLATTPLSIGPLLTFVPETERFQQAPEADELLSRNYRPGFECPNADQV